MLYLTQIWNFLGNIHYQGSFIPELIDNKHFFVISWNMDIHLCLLRKYPFKIYKDDYRATRGFSNCNDSSIFRSSHPEVLLQKGILEICSKFTRETHAEVWSHLSLSLGCSPVLLHILRNLFLRTPLGACFYISNCKGWLFCSIGKNYPLGIIVK